ncbi:hypothetical protein C8J57DRAFT_1508523 [Mycena rebaudengoi]|nr:hypothetical protein C8J57DRAFT_1508523 [Mycena rebaudengoi]
MASAQDAVISTPELLELSLSYLPMRDLLVTAPLRALFFGADPSSEGIRNPLLIELFPPFFAPRGSSHYQWPGKASAIMAMPSAQATEAFRRKEASWRRMLVSQPPVQTIIVTETCYSRRGKSKRCGALRDPSLRMGVLYDLAVPLINRTASSFCVRWHDGTERHSLL